MYWPLAEYQYCAMLKPLLFTCEEECVLARVVNGIWLFHFFAAWRVLRNSSTPYVLFTHGILDPWFKKQDSYQRQGQTARVEPMLAGGCDSTRVLASS